MKHTTFSLLLSFVFCPLLLFSARFRSVEIQMEQTGPLTMSAQVIVYIAASESMIDGFRETLLLSWGDDSTSEVSIVNGTDEDGDGILDGELIEPGFRKFVYAGEHVYPVAGRFVVSVTNPSRHAGILNINFPNSISTQMYTETEIEVFADNTSNHTPVLLEPGRVDLAATDEVFLHLPNGYDQDDDEVTYKLETAERQWTQQFSKQ